MECQNGDVEDHLQKEVSKSTEEENLPTQDNSLNADASDINSCCDNDVIDQEEKIYKISSDLENKDSNLTDNIPENDSLINSKDQDQSSIDSSDLPEDKTNGINEEVKTFSTLENIVDDNSKNPSIETTIKDNEINPVTSDSSMEKSDLPEQNCAKEESIDTQLDSTGFDKSIKKNGEITSEHTKTDLTDNVSDSSEDISEDKLVSTQEEKPTAICVKNENPEVDNEKLNCSNHLTKPIAKSVNTNGKGTKDDELLEELDRTLPTVDISVYEAQIRSLELTLAEEQNKKKQLAEKLSSHDAAAKRAISKLQNEIKVRVDQVTKMYDEARREKDSMVVKYAQAEQKQMETQQKFQNAARHAQELSKEKETLLNRLRGLKNEKQKILETTEAKNNEIRKLEQKIEAHKDANASSDVKVKWAQNKLKLEMEAHKDTKEKVEELQKKLKVAKEETEQIRRDCQSMIKTYQESEEIRSNKLDAELQQKVHELRHQTAEKAGATELHATTVKELEQLQGQHSKLKEEFLTCSQNLKSADTELTALKANVESIKADNKVLREEVERLREAGISLEREQQEKETLLERVNELESLEKELKTELDNCKTRENGQLSFAAAMSEDNARLQSANSDLGSRVSSLAAELLTIKAEYDNYKKSNETTNKDLNVSLNALQVDKDQLSTSLAEKTKKVEELLRELSEIEDEKKSMKRKHQANVKELTRQLQQARKRLESVDTRNNTESGVGGLGSRASSKSNSNQSLDTAGVEPSNPTPVPPVEEEVILPNGPVDQRALFSKIIKLQKKVARYSDKVEFLEDHNAQLTNDIRRKSRIIQKYILREESGTLTPASADVSKAAIAKRGGIMASVYSSVPQDGNMTLELSLDINRKLQAVLEDTLLKNITLKDNLETLGEEISKLSQENRNLHLNMKRS
ncbi:DgyrCDS2723 [Dimorphilus gyrociliatus]|uniref:DgyrCDS2723 n=1 Tax=Dimorphilus gyrociliatus TaxID=2664684 RepID=A0A7I8VE69_9ANNE|nr:DgyrCDS2723 [Dimorphilus gyrociliatus]